MQSLAVKYRPHVLSDLIGQDVVVQTLTNAIKANNLTQAYLMVGQFGCGKTTVARILAAMENCTVSPGVNPCGTCDICKGVFAGTHTDITEIDAASGAGKVEQIRLLKQDALYNPIDGAKSKVFIIDECHRMSPESNDALLKILEEPPAHVRFILCTTDSHKVRPAVESRCQRHDFNKVHWSLMAEHLKGIAEKEGLDVDEAALNLCSRLANGSVRNSINFLEKLVAYVGGSKVTIEDAQKRFGQVDICLYYDLIDQVVGTGEGGRPDAAAGFRIINKILAQGTSFDSVYTDIAEHMTNLMIGLTSSRAGEFVTLSDEGKRRFASQHERCKAAKKLGSVIASIRNLHEAKRAVELNLPPESALQSWFVESVVDFRR